MELRPYQVAASDAVLREWESVRSTLLVMPTGTGKTQTFCEVLKRRAPVGVGLVIAHRQELIGQAATRLREQGFDARIEMGDHRSSHMPNWYGQPVVMVASVQTLKGNRLLLRKEAFPFRTIVIDEAHHAPSVSYQKLLAEFPEAKVLGVTATPEHSRGMGMFESVAYQYEMAAAIEDKWLCDIRTKQIYCSDIDISNIKTKCGDLTDADIEQAMGTDKVLHQIAWPLVQEAGERSTVVFTPTVAMAHNFANVLAGYVSSEQIGVIDAKTPKELRQDTLQAFRDGHKRYLINCGILTEGVDVPRIACVAIARPTKSRTLYTQMVGRGTRRHHDKRELLVLDFVGNSGRHKLVTPLDILGGTLPKVVVERARFITRRDESILALDAIKKAQEQLARERAAKEEKARAASKVQVPVHYTTREVDLFGRKHQGVSDAQRNWLSKNGIELPPNASHHLARQMAAVLSKQKSRVPATEKQIGVLKRAGLRTNLSKAEASKAITALANNQWQPNDLIRKQWGSSGQLPF